MYKLYIHLRKNPLSPILHNALFMPNTKHYMLTESFPETGLPKIYLFQLIQQLSFFLHIAKIQMHINDVCHELGI